MKQIRIIVPDNCELKQEGNTYTVVEKEKKLTYGDVARELFEKKHCFFVNTNGEIVEVARLNLSAVEQLNNCTSRKQVKKLLAINKLINVAKYLNGDWQPDWIDKEEGKYYIQIDNVCNDLHIDCTGLFNCSIVYFKTEELAERAIEILGEETIKLALCTDY